MISPNSKWFSSFEDMLREADHLLKDDTFDSEDRAAISSFYNGRPTMSPSEASERGVAEITNHLFGYDSINTAREQLAGIYSKSPTLIKTEVRAGPPSERVYWEQMIQKYLNIAIKRSGRLKPQFKSFAGEIVLFGSSMMLFKDPYDWCPTTGRPFVPRGTGIIPEEIPYCIIPSYLSVRDLEGYLRIAIRGQKNKRPTYWNIPALRRAIKALTSNTGFQESYGAQSAEIPADEEEYNEQEGMTSHEASRIQLPVYFVYTSHPDKPGSPYDMSVVARFTPHQKEHATKEQMVLDEGLFHHPSFFTKASEFIHTFFLDCNIGGPTLWHRTMGLGRLNYDSDVAVEEVFNQAMQGSKENLRRLWEVKNGADTETLDRWLAGEMWSNVIPEGVRAAEVPKNSNFDGAFTTLGMLSNLSKRNASGSIANTRGERQTNELEVQALERQGRNAETMANRMNDVYENLDALMEEIFLRFTNPSILPIDKGYNEIHFFQEKMKEFKIPLEFIRTVKNGELVNVTVKTNRVTGDGDRVREIMVNQMLLSRLHLYPEESQKKILRRVTALETQDFELADELVPVQEQPDSNQVGRANQENNTAFIQGKTPSINADDLHMIHIPEHLSGLQGMLQKGDAQGWEPMDLIGFRALGGHAMAHIQKVGAIPEQKDIATRFSQQLEGIARRGQEHANNLEAKVQAEEDAKNMTPKDQHAMQINERKQGLAERAQLKLEEHRDVSQDFRERVQANKEGLSNEQLFNSERQVAIQDRAQKEQAINNLRQNSGIDSRNSDSRRN